MSLRTKIFKYSFSLFLGSFALQGFSFIVRFLMIQFIPSLIYSNFLIVLYYFNLFLVFSHLDFYAPIMQILGGKTFNSSGEKKVNQTPDFIIFNLNLVKTLFVFNFTYSLILSILLASVSLYFKMNILLTITFSVALLLQSLMINFSAILKAFDQINYVSTLNAVTGILRFLGVLIIILSINTDHYTLFYYSYLIPQIVIPFFLISKLDILPALRTGKFDLKIIYKLLKRSKYILFSDFIFQGLFLLIALYIESVLGKSKVPVFDLVVLIISLGSLLASNLSSSLLIFAQHIANPKKFLTILVYKVLIPLVIIDLTFFYILKLFNIYSEVISYFGLQIILSLDNLAVVSLIVLFLIFSVTISGFSFGIDKFLLDTVSKSVSAIVFLLLMLILRPNSFSDILLILALYFFLSGILQYPFLIKFKKNN